MTEQYVHNCIFSYCSSSRDFVVVCVKLYFAARIENDETLVMSSSLKMVQSSFIPAKEPNIGKVSTYHTERHAHTKE
jgi:hypothetical protein